MGCQGFESSIPDRAVSVVRNITLSGTLSDVGGYYYLDSRLNEVDRIGYGGILIYHGKDNSFYAVDLACPHEISQTVKVGRPNELGICKCDSCGEEFDMSFGMGTPTKGIAKEALKHYTVTFRGTDEIIITL